MRYFACALALVIGLSACASSPDYAYSLDDAMVSTWDQDGDGYVNEEEWDDGFAEVNLFRDWDVDGNGYIDNAEWTVGVTDWEEYYSAPSWTVWDLDDDDRLQSDEMAEGLFKTWDSDENGLLDPAEFEVGTDLV